MKEYSPVEIGRRIRAIRGKLTQTAFAKILGVNMQNYISRYEGGRVPSPSLLLKMSEHGKVSVDWILTGKNKNSSGSHKESGLNSCGQEPIDKEIIDILKKVKPTDKKTVLKMIQGIVKSY